MVHAVVRGRVDQQGFLKIDPRSEEASAGDLHLVSFSRSELMPELPGTAAARPTVDDIPIARFPYYQGAWMRVVMFECADRRYFRYGLEGEAREGIERELRTVGENRPISRISAAHIRIDDGGTLRVRLDVVGYAATIQISRALARAFPEMQVELEPTEALRRHRL